MKVPERRAAIQDRNDALIILAVHRRESEALLTRAAQSEGDLAKLLGDAEGQSAASRRASQASLRAKLAEQSAAKLEGRDSSTPAGLMTSTEAG